ncbi:NrtA/SsuA/CpmA family ABC transporter substrate-binding protein [Xylophilus sp. GOD-11R]|uniref:ABC transporter substrate-binding protein n=1 Tax=Xylophilus sp. GOD-11R TaxID=3089814 RepID=UPI00298D1786|nr:NrtA/SsuA/CpmA family ABC transporter substrate-binding protein [Xylophilus sp. GOD-11R]WPB55574.1 NrtA/SsuA/CpmA family ABC transporter substrate-binding protein [Xylophilus sp. GOD-11R]
MSINRRNFNQLGIAGVLMSGIAPALVRSAQSMDTVRFGWSNTVIVSAQTMHVLKNTDIAERNGIKLEQPLLMNSPAVSEAIASGSTDMGTVSDFSSVTMMAAGAPIVPVAHQSSFRSGIMVTKKSGIKSVAELKGKQIYGTFGITAYLNAQEAVRKAGLTVGRDVNFVNINTPELTDAVRAQRIDAFFMWDPWLALFEDAGLASPVAENTSPAMVLQAHTRFIKEKPEVLRRFLKAHNEALFWASQNHTQANAWFRSLEPAKSIPENVIEKASGFDPQWSARKIADVSCTIKPEGIASMEKMGQWGFGEKLLPKVPEVAKLVNTEISAKADQDTKAGGFDPATVKLKSA